jgi:NADH:ubiquinone oxidoreductase subunit F (NADH-binding)
MASIRRAAAERPGGTRLTITAVPPAYLAGEETALIRHLDGGPLKPTVTPPMPFERGLRRRPTLVQNAETMAHIALIARHGAAWFREAGTPADPGTALVTVSGDVRQPGVREIALGTPLDAVLESAGVAEPIRAVLVGGNQGIWVDGARVSGRRLE